MVVELEYIIRPQIIGNGVASGYKFPVLSGWLKVLETSSLEFEDADTTRS